MEIQTAQDFQALSIARLIMQAMNYDCCRYFTGPDHSLDDFERVMTSLVLSENSQYSYRNTLVAIDEDGRLCGICVSYDGGKLHERIATQLLNATVEKAKTLGLPAVGLLVDTGNPKAEKLYERVGFRYVGDNSWGGHTMKHLQYAVNQ